MAHVVQAPAALPEGRIFITSKGGQSLRLPASWIHGAEVQPAMIPGLEPIGRDGRNTTGRRVLGVRTGTLAGSLNGVPGAGPNAVFAILWPPDLNDWGWGPAHSQADALLAILQDAPLQLRLDRPDARFLAISPTSITKREVSYDRVVFDVAWETDDDPLWRDSSPTVSAGVISRGATRVVTVDGSAPVMPIITIKGVSGGTVSPRLINERNGATLEYRETLASGNELVLDTGELTATRSAVSVLASMSDEFALGFKLEPGENVIRLESVSGNADVSISYRCRWH